MSMVSTVSPDSPVSIFWEASAGLGIKKRVRPQVNGHTKGFHVDIVDFSTQAQNLRVRVELRKKMVSIWEKGTDSKSF